MKCGVTDQVLTVIRREELICEEQGTETSAGYEQKKYVGCCNGTAVGVGG